jgi:acetyl-CoA C-acetyltransferase
MHAIAEIVERIRRARDSYGIVVANGGYLSKHSVGIYAGNLTSPWIPISSSREQHRAKAGNSIAVTEKATGIGRIESHAAIYANGNPTSGFILGRLDGTNARFLALVDLEDQASLAGLFEDDVIGRSVSVVNDDNVNYFRLLS